MREKQKNRLKILEEALEVKFHESKKPDRDYSGFTLEEQKIMEKADEISERMKEASNPNSDKFGVSWLSKADRETLVQAAEISEKYQNATVEVN